MLFAYNFQYVCIDIILFEVVGGKNTAGASILG